MPAPFPSLEPGVPELPPTIVRHDGAYELMSRVRVPHPRNEVFAFFSDPRNLRELTPEHVGFEILNEGDVDMKEGATIDCRLNLRIMSLRRKVRVPSAALTWLAT